MSEWDELTNSQDWREWEEHVRTEMLPKLQMSGCTASIVPEDAGDPKFWVELGATIMLDKPIILLVHEGRRLPGKLVQVADRIIEMNFDDPASVTQGAKQLQQILQEMTNG